MVTIGYSFKHVLAANVEKNNLIVTAYTRVVCAERGDAGDRSTNTEVEPPRHPLSTKSPNQILPKYSASPRALLSACRDSVTRFSTSVFFMNQKQKIS
jgi:hypothetical protein